MSARVVGLLLVALVFGSLVASTATIFGLWQALLLWFVSAGLALFIVYTLGLVVTGEWDFWRDL